MLEHIVDPDRNFYKEMKLIKAKKVVAISPEEAPYPKGAIFDPVCEAFATGSSGTISTWEKEEHKDLPVIIRGVGATSQRALEFCMENNREFYAIDTGYMQPSKTKDYHRITKSALQNLGPVIKRPIDRLRKLGWSYRNTKTRGSKILLCPPSDKVMQFYNLNLDKWMEETISEIKSKTNRPIEIRLKPARHERVTTNTIWQALDDAYCLVTFNSIAATEALLYSVPAIALAPNAATVLCNTSINDIENLYLPTKEETVQFAAHLSYCQFTIREMRNGTAWNIVNEGS